MEEMQPHRPLPPQYLFGTCILVPRWWLLFINKFTVNATPQTSNIFQVLLVTQKHFITSFCHAAVCGSAAVRAVRHRRAALIVAQLGTEDPGL